MSFGVDYAWSRPTITAMKAAGVEFVCRYLSHDATGKNISPAELQALRAAGMALILIWESTASRALAGVGAGQADALDALSQARTLGLPDDRPIFFAVDFDAVPTEQPKINDYFNGVASVIGLNRTGMYAGYGPISRAFDAGKIRYGWQTLAWSAGKWDGRAGIQQYAIEQRIGGQDVDYNRSVLDDFGQWTAGDSVAFTSADKEWMTSVLVPAIAKAVWGTDNLIKAADGGTVNPYWTPAFHVESLGKLVRSISAALAGLDPSVDEAQIIAGVLSGIGPALDPERLADAIATHMGTDMASATLDALKARLES